MPTASDRGDPSPLDGDTERPPGPGRAAAHAHLEAIDIAECWRLLGLGGVGRFVFLAARGPIAVPVNYQVVDGAVAFRTEATSSLAGVGDGEAVGLEVDRFDEAAGEGWSVVASGLLEHVRSPEALARLARSGIHPWAGDPRETYLTFVPVEVTGRRIRTGR